MSEYKTQHICNGRFNLSLLLGVG